MSEKFEKCPNCGAKLSGWFSKSIIEDDQIKNTNESIKDLKNYMAKAGILLTGRSAKELEEKEVYCSGCYVEKINKYEKWSKIWEASLKGLEV